MTVSHASQHRPASSPSSGSMWRATLSGFSANLVGIGLARFAYTPLLPAIVGAHWFVCARGGEANGTDTATGCAVL
jgi:hypothetical protein